MDFDLSKENIQPLRGGRNATQLTAALQAQTDLEHQKELLLQKQEFEKIISNYTGPDPLENWYNYVSWIEQSFPKHGHEGNLSKSLEECLSKFERDPRYKQDPRLCKLFIKYFDMQPNPIESFQTLHQVGTGTECADLYKAWAYYYEANNDFKRAEHVFKLGFQAGAQPHDELENAHLSFLLAVGRHTVQGIQDPNQLSEKRRALTSLKGFRQKHRTVVPSQRTGSSVADYLPGVLKVEHARSSNAKVEIFQDDGASHGAGPSQVEVKPKSILDSVTKREIVHKENFLKAGTWNSARKGAAPSSNVINFIVHEDENEQHPPPPKESTANVTPPAPVHDDFADLVTELYIPEPNTATKISQYNISTVYANQTEYCFEELLAQRYLEKRQQKLKEELPKYELASNYMSPQFQTTPIKSKMSVLKLNSPAGYQELNGYDDKRKQIASTNLIQQFNYETKPNLAGNTLEEAAKAVESISEPKWVDPVGNITTHTKEAMYEVNNLWSDNQYSLMEPKVENFQILEDNPTYLVQQNDQPFQIYSEGGGDVYKSNNFKKNNYYEYPQQHHQVHQHSPQQPQQQHHQYQQQQPMQRQMQHPQQVMHNQYQNSYQQPVQHFQQPQHHHHQPPPVTDFEETLSTQTFNVNLFSASTPTQPRKTPQTYGAMPVHHYSQQPPPQQHLPAQPQPIQNNQVYHKMMSPANNYNLEQQHHNQHHYQQQPQHQQQQPHINHSAARQQLFQQYPQHKVEPIPVPQENYVQFQQPQPLQQHPQPQQQPPQSHRPHQLSSILENSKECGSSSSGGSSNAVTTFGSTTLKTPNRGETLPPLKEVSQVSRDTCSMEYELGEALLQLGSQRNQPKPAEVEIYVDQNSKHSTESLGGSYHSPQNEVEEVMDWDEHSNSMDYSIGCQNLSAILASDKPVDPFDSRVIDCLLKKARFPLPRYSGFIKVQNVPKFLMKETYYLKNDRFCLEKVLGKGAYGTVVKASNLADGSTVALKYQRPANFWEYYICQEIQHRIKDSILLFSYMNISKIYFSQAASVFLYEFSKYGSLLTVGNKVKVITGKLMKDVVVYHFVNEMLRIVSALHQCKIIHADIKPDNFLVMRLPPDSGRLSLQLIDFGCSIDMSLFPPDMCFYKVINTEDFICPEMREGKPWTYQTDMYCLAASAYVLLMGEYMRLKKEDGLWTFTKKLPRYVSWEVWKPFFRQLLNIESCDALPDLTTIASNFQGILNERHSDLSYELRNIANIMNGR